MTGVLHPARVRRPSNEWLPASDDRNRAHRVACRPYASEHGKVQHECRLNYRLTSKRFDGILQRIIRKLGELRESYIANLVRLHPLLHNLDTNNFSSQGEL